MYEILSPKRLELLRFITNHSNEQYTINQLAQKLNRRQEAISRDTITLSKYNIIKKEKQQVHIKAIYDSLDLKLTTTN